MSAVMPNSVARPAVRIRAPRFFAPFWRWWSAELTTIFTPLIDKYWVDRANTVTLILAANGEMPAVARLDGRDVRILLATDAVLQKIASYPGAVEENLDEVLVNDLDRQTPFTPEQVYLAHRVVQRFDGADGVAKVDVALTMVLRRVVDGALQGVRSAGGRVYSLGVVGDQHHIELLPTNDRPARRLTTLQKVNLGLLLAVVVSVLAALVVPTLLTRSHINAMTPLVEKARVEAEATRKIESEYQRLQQQYQIAAGKKYAAFPAIDIVEELTKLSPDTTWLQSFEMKLVPATKGSTGKPATREIQMIGEAASASKMIELLEQSTLLQNTTQRAQTTRGSQPNTERFQIATEVKTRTAPEMIDLLAEVEKPAVSAVGTAALPLGTLTAPPMAPAAAPTLAAATAVVKSSAAVSNKIDHGQSAAPAQSVNPANSVSPPRVVPPAVATPAPVVTIKLAVKP